MKCYLLGLIAVHVEYEILVFWQCVFKYYFIKKKKSYYFQFDLDVAAISLCLKVISRHYSRYFVNLQSNFFLNLKLLNWKLVDVKLFLLCVRYEREELKSDCDDVQYFFNVATLKGKTSFKNLISLFQHLMILHSISFVKCHLKFYSVYCEYLLVFEKPMLHYLLRIQNL